MLTVAERSTVGLCFKWLNNNKATYSAAQYAKGLIDKQVHVVQVNERGSALILQRG